MEVVPVNADTKFGSMGLWEMKNQNKYGVMYGFNKKRDLVVNEFVGDYYIYRRSENGKIYFCMDSNNHLGNAIRKIQESVTIDKAFTFKPLKDKLYIKMSAEQANAMPLYHDMQISVNVYGVFLHSSTNLAFIQCELTCYRATPRIDFVNTAHR